MTYESRLLPENSSRKSDIEIDCDYENFEFLKEMKLGSKGQFQIVSRIISENLSKENEVSKRVRIDKIEIEKEIVL